MRCGFCAVVAARRSGLTWLEPPCGPSCGSGVFAPVPAGVEMLEGISDVKIVADEGEITYLDCITARSASLKPASS